MSRSRKRSKILGQFSARPIEMLESPAWRVLSLSAHRLLSRIEIEHAHHGGNDNGKLPVTYEDFVAYGMDRDTIAPAIREAEALGFLVVTERGCAGNAEFRTPSKYRLTYRDAEDLPGDGTHEWRKITTIEQAKAIHKLARMTANPSSQAQVSSSAAVRLKKKLARPHPNGGITIGSS